MTDWSVKQECERAGRLNGALRDGHYARAQLFCRSRVIAWSHRSRFRVGRGLVKQHAGGRLLDYGCGDGTFLATVADLFPDATGADLAQDAVDACARRFAALTNLSFAHTSALRGPEHDHSFDVVTCMETLEHCVPAAVDDVLDDLRRLVKTGGVVIISVPIEIGPTLLIKQMLRAIAGWRRLGQYQYRERYAWGELLRMIFAGAGTQILRPTYHAGANDSAMAWHGHKGFNWRAMRRRIEREFVIERTCFSPLGWTRGWLSSQAWFVCRAR